MPSPAKSRYRPADDLPRLIGIWPHDSNGQGGISRVEIVARLEAALRSERRRGVAGHWTYDVQRHAMLITALAAERALLGSSGANLTFDSRLRLGE